MKFKLNLRALWLGVVLIVATACGSSSGLEGKWAETGGEQKQLELLSDGTVLLSLGPRTVSGKWRQLDDGRVLMEIGSVSLTGRLVDDRLEFTVPKLNPIGETIGQNVEIYERVDLNVEEGARLLAAGNVDSAIEKFSRAIDTHPDFERALYFRAQAYLQRHDYDRAIEDYDRLLQLHSEDAVYFNNRCFARALEGTHLDLAMSDCNEALQLKPESAYILDTRGFVHFKRAEYSAALQDYDAALRVNGPHQPSSQFMRGIIRLRMGDISGGSADIAAVDARNPDVRVGYATHGVVPESFAIHENGATDLVISVDANETVYVGDTLVADNRRLDESLRSGGQIYLRGDRHARFQGIANVLRALRRASFTQITLAGKLSAGAKSVPIQLAEQDLAFAPVEIEEGLSLQWRDDAPAIQIDFDGSILWNRTAITDRNALKGMLDAYARRWPNGIVRIYPNRLSQFGQVVNVIADVQRAGVRVTTVVFERQP